MIETGDQALITQVLESYKHENELMMDSLMNIWYYWRGGISRDDIWMMTPIEREAAVDFLNKRFKEVGDIAKKTGQVPGY